MHRYRKVTALAIATAGLVACSSDGTETGPWSADSLDVTNGEILDIDLGFSQELAAISPSGELAAVVRAGEFCVEALVPVDSDAVPLCVDYDTGDTLVTESLNWSSDESQLVFAGRSGDSGAEPDIWKLRIADDEQLEVLTDDGVDGNFDAGDLDISPFFGPDDSVHFLRWDALAERYVLHQIDDGEVTVLEDLQLPIEARPSLNSVRQLNETSWVIHWFSGDDWGLSVLDLDEDRVDTVELPDDSQELLSAVGRYAIVAAPTARSVSVEPFDLVDIETGRTITIEAGLGSPATASEMMASIALTPAGDAIVSMIRSFDGTPRFVVLPLVDGVVGEPVELAGPRDLAEFPDFENIDEFELGALTGLGSDRVELVATTSGQVMFSAQDQIGVLTVVAQ